MKLAALLFPLALLTAAMPAQADMSLIGRSTLVTMNMPSTGQEALYVRNKFLRRDTMNRGRAYTYLYNIGTKELTILDHLMRNAEVRTMQSANNQNAAVGNVKMDLKPTGRKQALQTWECLEHTLAASMPAQLGPETATMIIAGNVWLARNAVERQEINPFAQSISARDFFMSTPGSLTGAASPQSLGINEVFKRILPKGMLCAGDIELKYEGGGRMVDMARRSATKMNLTYERVSDAELKDETFAIPAGYRVQKINQ